MGGLASERSGIVNIGLEGKMLTAACITAIVGLSTQNPWFGLLAGVLGAVSLSLFHLLIVQVFRVDHIVSGMGINALAIGGTNFAWSRLSSPSSEAKSMLFDVMPYYLIAAILPFALAWVLRKTRLGLRLLAVGNDPHKSEQMGVHVGTVRLTALAACGVFCGLAGALIASNAGTFTDNMTAGRGFIALAALILGAWRPLATLGACVLFGFFDALQLQLQGTQMLGANIPSQVWNAAPYLVTLIALAGFLGRGAPPAALGKT
jgi:simple sugar transport system permease protein